MCSVRNSADPLSPAGWQLGSEPEIQVATVVSNHLASGIMKYFGDAFRFGPAVNLFEKLVVKEGEVACLLAQSYLGMSESVSGSTKAAIELTLLHSQTRRSRLFAFCRPLSRTTHNPTHFSTFNAISSEQKTSTTGRSSSLSRLSTALLPNLLPGPSSPKSTWSSDVSPM